MAQAAKREPFRVLEFGIGEKPSALIKRAQKALEQGKTHWDFAGADTKIDIDAALRRARIEKVPENLNLIEDCILHTLWRAPSGSADVIFGSYVFNNLRTEKSCIMPKYSCQAAFLALARRTLRPGGRLVLVQNKKDIVPLKKFAKEFGFGFCAVELPEEMAKKSPSHAIRMRATPERRIVMIERHYKKSEAVTEEEISESIRKGAIKSREEWAKPFVFILRKPRGGPEPEAVIIEGPLSGLSPEQLALARAIVDSLARYLQK